MKLAAPLALLSLSFVACSGDRAASTSDASPRRPATATPSDTGPRVTDGASASDGVAGDGGSGASAAVDGGGDIVDGRLATLIRMEDARRLSRPVVERLVESPDVVLRRRALRALGRLGDPEGLGPLRSALTEGDEETRRVALTSLGQLASPAHDDAERVIRAFLDLDPRPGDRRVAVEALGRIGSNEATGILLESLESPEPSLRAAAARALGQMAIRRRETGEAATIALASHLADADASVRLASAYALSRRRDLRAESRDAVGASLTKALRHDEDVEVRILAARALGALDTGGAGYLIAALESDADWRVRTASASALGRRATAAQRARGLKIAWTRLAEDRTRLTGADLHPLMALLGEAAEQPARPLGHALRTVEANATKALGEETDAARRLALAHIACAAALAMDSATGRAARVGRCAVVDPPLIDGAERKLLVAQALQSSTAPGALNRLKVLRRDEDVRVRLAAVDAVGHAFTPLRLSLLEASLSDESPIVVAAAASKLVDAADYYSPKVIQAAQELTVTEHTETGPITYSMSTPETKGREPPARALARALKTVDADRDVETAIDLAKAVGATKAGEAAPQLRPLAGHYNRSVRRAARKALEALDLDPGPELRPDPPNLVDPAVLLRLAATRPEVEITTTKGTFAITLRPDVAPATVANFLGLVERRFYDGIAFHRVVPGFVVQTGDPTGTSYGGPGYTIRCEVNDLRYVRGSVGMALAGPDTGGSQFFITYSTQPHLDRRYTLFGQVTEGMEVVDAIQPWDRITTIRRRPAASAE